MKYLCFAVLVCIAVAAIFIAPDFIRDNTISEIDNVSFEEAWNNEYYKVPTRSQKAVWNQVHVMANTLIKADHIWGEEEISEEKVNALLLEVRSSDFDDKERLLTILLRWKEEDFSHGVDDHNYVWDRLGGSVGEAFDLRDEYKP